MSRSLPPVVNVAALASAGGACAVVRSFELKSPISAVVKREFQPELLREIPRFPTCPSTFKAPRDAAEDRTADESAAELAERQLGLVRAAYLTVLPDSRLVLLQLPTFGASEPPEPGTRGKVDGLSDDAHRRMMCWIHSLPRSLAQPAMVTLTFPDSLIPCPRRAKKCLQKLFKRWRRRYPWLWGLWRLEAHPGRSADMGFAVPHFHLLVWGGWIDRYQLSLDWAQVVGAPEFDAHLAAGTKVESVRSFRGVCSYVAKYIAKREECSLGQGAGRVWGIFNGAAVPVAKSVTVKLSAAEVVRVVRHCRRLLFSRGVETEWMTRAIYCEEPSALLRLLDTT